MNRRVVCRECRAPVWTENRAWCKCDVCGSRIWIDRSHPKAPPELPRFLDPAVPEVDGS